MERDDVEEFLLQDRVGSYNSCDKDESTAEQNVSSPDLGDAQPHGEQKLSDVIKGRFFLIAMVVCYIGSISSSQMATSTTNIFVLNAIRYTAQATVALGIVTLTNASLSFPRQYVWILIGTILSDIIFSSSIYFAASFQPVGNVDAMFLASYITMSTIVDIVKKNVHLQALGVSLVAVLGILLVSQPWNKYRNIPEILGAPCDYLDGDISVIANQSNTSSLLTDVNQNAASDDLVGYLLTVVAAIASTATGNFSRQLFLKQCSVGCILFWMGLAGSFLSHLTLVTVTSVNQENYYFLPSGPYCFLFCLLFIVCSCIANVFANFSYKYVVVSEVAVANVMVTIALYTLQRTVLSAFQGGNANIMEVFGIVLIIMCLLATFFKRTIEYLLQKARILK